MVGGEPKRQQQQPRMEGGRDDEEPGGQLERDTHKGQISLSTPRSVGGPEIACEHRRNMRSVRYWA